MARKDLFVVMPFGTREATHAPSGLIEFDRVYLDAIREAAESDGWNVTRIDELAAPGTISTQYLDQILNADLVVADISISNANVFYELGIRHSISNAPTVLIAAEGSPIPFDLSALRVLFYVPAALDLFVPRLAAAFAAAAEQPESENPVRVYLERVGLKTPSSDSAAFEQDVVSRIERSRNREQLIALWNWLRPSANSVTTAALQTLAARLADNSEWKLAADVLEAAARQRADDFEIHRQRGWYLRQLGDAHDADALESFERALQLNPNDPETLGMMAGRLKRLDELGGALDLYDRASVVSPNSLYIGVNRAAIRVVIGDEEFDDGIARYARLADSLESFSSERPLDEWEEVVLAEAYFALGQDDLAYDHFRTAIRVATTPVSVGSALEQLRFFRDKGFRSESAESLLRRVRESQSAPDPAPLDDDPGNTSSHAGPIILHLSDIHFGGPTDSESKTPRHRFFDGVDSQNLIEHLRGELVRGDAGSDFDRERLHVVVSGDFVWTANKAEFEQALEFLRQLVELLAIDAERVHLVPGNHDVNWAIAAADRERRLDGFVRLLADFYGDDLFRERYPLVSWPLAFNDAPPEPHQLLSVAIDRPNGVLFCGLNSCVLEDEQHHYGYVGQRQQKELRRLLANYDDLDDLVRVAVMHHHLHPYPEFLEIRASNDVFIDLSVVRDAGSLERGLEQLRFDLVLHGHKHKPQLRETRVREVGQQTAVGRPLIVCGAGSVSCTHLEHAQGNQYQWIEIERVPRVPDVQFARVVWRELPLTFGADWATTQTWSVDG